MIREVRHDDVEAVHRIVSKVHKGLHYDVKDFIHQCIRSKGSLTLVAEDDESGEVLGVAIGGIQGTLGIVDLLAVEPGHQGHGIGQALLAELTARVRAHGARQLAVLTWEQAAGFYAAFGFRPAPQVQFMVRLLEP